MEGELNSSENLFSWSGSGRHPTLSLDEVVIRSRGKRRIPVKFSPERKEVPATEATPITSRYHPRCFSPGQINKSRPECPRSQAIEVTRKKLFSEGDGLVQSVPTVQEKDTTHTDSDFDSTEETPAKKIKTTELIFNVNNNEDKLKLIKVLSRDQMANILTELAKHEMTTQQKLTEMLHSEPDISAQLENLAYHGMNVYKALPRNRLTNRHDSFSYSKVSVHLAVFRKVLLEDLFRLEESEHWPTIIRYVMAAWDIVKKSPIWEDTVHNKYRICCFRYLATAAMKTHKNYELDVNTLKKLLEMMASSSMAEFQSYCDLLSRSMGRPSLKI